MECENKKLCNSVYRRVGGLEVQRSCGRAGVFVYRRVGGLEVFDIIKSVVLFVYRRVGGLEDEPSK